MNVALQNLLQLQALEFSDQPERGAEKQIGELRALIPAPILGHYDRLRVRGKKGVAVVRNQTCTGCHLKQPLGKVTILMRGEDVQLCDSCGRYLYLPDPAENKFVEHMEASKPAAKPAKRTRRAPAARKTTVAAAAV